MGSSYATSATSRFMYLKNTEKLLLLKALTNHFLPPHTEYLEQVQNIS